MPSEAHNAFTAEQHRLSVLTRKGIGMPIAGMIYWIAVAVLLRSMPMNQALVWAFVATGPVFPLGYMITKAFGGDLFAKSDTLTSLGMQLAALQLFYWPIIIVVFKNAPEWTPFTLAVLFGSHFLPYGWLYRSRAYMALTILVTLALSVAVLVAGSPLYESVPLITAGCYLIAVSILWFEVKGLDLSVAEAA